ncbi:MAG: hypothetical protein WCE54_14120 [Ignavibacteriaceae bacterium]
MKKILNLIGMLIVALLISGGYSFAQNNQQNQGNQNMDKQNTTQTDTNYAKSMAYYKYAKKNIIDDSTKDKTYKGKWHNQDSTNKSSNGMMKNSNMNSSGNNKMNSNHSMMNNSKNKMGHMKGDSTQWKKKN